MNKQSLLFRNKNISYFLLGKKIYIILNSNAKSGNVSKIMELLSRHFPLYSFNIILSSSTNMVNSITQDVMSENVLFIVVGGDGTLNNTIQYLINSKAIIGLIPSGTANDLATYFNLPSKIEQSLRVISQGYVTPIDTIKINNYHLVTVGGLGFPVEIAKSVNEFKASGVVQQFLHKFIFKSSIYKIFSFFLLFKHRSNILKNYGKVFVDGNLVFEGNFVAILFGKQEKIGKKFLACPGVFHDSPFMKVSILKYTSFMRNFLDILLMSQGSTSKVKNLVSFNSTDFRIQTSKFHDVLGDGEILNKNNEFIGKIYPKSINLITKL